MKKIPTIIYNGVTIPTEDVGGDGTLSVLIDPDSRSLQIAEKNVIKADIYACNGIIHIIDGVIL